MTDCPNAEIRDRLPDLLHERLDARARSAVMAHLDACGDCRAELELLRGLRNVLAAGVAPVDVARIVRALPARAAVRRRRLEWRIAAAVTLLVIGGSGAAVVTRVGHPFASQSTSDSRSAVVRQPQATPDSQPQPSTSDLAAAPQPVASPRQAAATKAAPEPSPQQVAQGQTETGLAMTGRLGELSEAELRVLLKEIDELEALPITEPEPVVIPIAAGKRVSPRGA